MTPTTSLLGAILLEPSALDVAADQLRADDFGVPWERSCFETMLAMDRAGKAIDTITLHQELRQLLPQDDTHGIRISRLLDGSTRAANASTYCKQIREEATIRRLRHLAAQIDEKAEAGATAKELVNLAEESTYKIAEGVYTERPSSVADIMRECHADLDARAETPGLVNGVPSGLNKLDEMTCGWQPGDMVVLGARPSMGKTALALQMARQAGELGKHTLVFSVEMARKQLGYRFIAAEARLRYQDVRSARLTPDEWQQLTASTERLSGLPVTVDDNPRVTVLEMYSKARRAKREKGLDIVFVDYLQLLRASERRRNQFEEIAEISMELKHIARSLGVPVVALCQLNRECEKRQPPRPMMADLGGSGQIERDADAVMLLWRPEFYIPRDADGNLPDDAAHKRGKAELILAKQRNGRSGTVNLRWDADHQTFTEEFTY